MKFFIEKGIIHWNITSTEQIEIIFHNQGNESYVSFVNGTHDHVEIDEIWEYLKSINEEQK